MADTPEPEKKANSQPKPSELPSPKRGAFPTPRAEIEKAKPYVPETDPANQSATEPASPENTDPKAGSQENSKIPE